jgi:DNA polymerase III subunit alpha
MKKIKIKSIQTIHEKDTFVDITLEGTGDSKLFFSCSEGKTPVITHNCDYPDIDTDFENQEAIFEYIKGKYGRDKVGHIGALQLNKSKMAIKDAYKVLRPDGEFSEINEITSQLDSADQGEDEKEHYFKLTDPNDPEYSKILGEFMKQNPDIENIVVKLLNKVKTIKPHACGIVISDEPLDEQLPMWIDKNNRYTTEYPGSECEKVGLVKIDILALSTLKDIASALRKIKERKGIEIDINNLDVTDKETIEAFRVGNTDTVFQFNTETLSGACKLIKPTSLEELGIINAIVRPGPLEAKFMETYIYRKNGIITEEQRVMPDGTYMNLPYDHPGIREITKETKGLCIYQEQMMKIFELVGGFSKKDVNVIRKAISKKNRAVLEDSKVKFKEYATTKLDPVWTEDQVDAFYKDLEGWGNYAFNKSHAIEYSYLGFVCQYLKTHYPIEWWTGVLENASENDVQVAIKNNPKLFLDPDINVSGNAFFLTADDKFQMPLIFIKGVGESAIDEIMKHKPFTSIEDFVKRMSRARCKANNGFSLIIAGAFKSLHPELTEYQIMERYVAAMKEKGDKKIVIPEEYAMVGVDRLALDKAKKAVNPFYSFSIIDKYRELFDYQITHIDNLKLFKEGDIIIVGGMIDEFLVKKAKNGKDFGKIKLNDGGGQVTVMFWEADLKKYKSILSEGRLVQVRGKINKFNNRLMIAAMTAKDIGVSL